MALTQAVRSLMPKAERLMHNNGSESTRLCFGGVSPALVIVLV